MDGHPLANLHLTNLNSCLIKFERFIHFLRVRAIETFRTNKIVEISAKLRGGCVIRI